MRVLVVYADVGGGHKSVAMALQEAFHQYHPDVSVSLLDILRDYAPFPLRKFPQIYPILTRGDAYIWKWLYLLTDGTLQAALISGLWWPVLHQHIRSALSAYPADAIVSVYPLLNRDLGRYLKRLGDKPLFAILVTDLGTAHTLWFSRYADHYLVPTEMVYRRILKSGIEPDKISLTGLPVSPVFAERDYSKTALREELGLHTHLPMVLLIGGAEGMGGLEAIADAIDSHCPRAELVVIAGRNKKLLKRLTARQWNIPVKVLGFVSDMHKWMKSADLLLSKAGPSTISEALVVGVPLIITGYLPGQEKANVQFVVDSGAGVYQPDPEGIAQLVNEWTAPGNSTLAEMTANARLVGKADAARKAVDLLYRMGEARRDSQVNGTQSEHTVFWSTA